jgi:protein-tyrosine phosphatase
MVRKGRLYRSDALARLTDDDIKRLAGVGIARIYDLRSPSERARAGNRWPAHGDTQVSVVTDDTDVMLSGANHAQMIEKFRSPSFAPAEALDLMLATYRSLPQVFGQRLKALLLQMAGPDDEAMLVHCTAGKDRTGFICAMVLTALDVHPATVQQDYLLSRSRFTVDRLIAAFVSHIPDPMPASLRQAYAVMAEVRPEYLQASFDQMTKEYGSVDAWLREHAGLDASLRRELQSRFVLP